jgi:hypothetical protein
MTNHDPEIQVTLWRHKQRRIGGRHSYGFLGTTGVRFWLNSCPSPESDGRIRPNRVAHEPGGGWLLGDLAVATPLPEPLGTMRGCNGRQPCFLKIDIPPRPNPGIRGRGRERANQQNTATLNVIFVCSCGSIPTNRRFGFCSERLLVRSLYHCGTIELQEFQTGKANTAEPGFRPCSAAKINPTNAEFYLVFGSACSFAAAAI